MMWVALSTARLLNGIAAKSLVKFILATMRIEINDTKSIFAITIIHLIYFREIFIEGKISLVQKQIETWTFANKNLLQINSCSREEERKTNEYIRLSLAV